MSRLVNRPLRAVLLAAACLVTAYCWAAPPTRVKAPPPGIIYFDVPAVDAAGDLDTALASSMEARYRITIGRPGLPPAIQVTGNASVLNLSDERQSYSEIPLPPVTFTFAGQTWVAQWLA